MNAAALLDLDRYLQAKDQFIANYLIDPNTAVYDRRPLATLSSLSLGFGYLDECTTFTVNYVMAPRDVAVTSGEKDRSHTLLVRLELRTLGEANLRQNLGGVDTSQEGVTQ